MHGQRVKHGLAVAKWHGALCTCAVVAPYVREISLQGNAWVLFHV